ncbi:MAG TPA: hypothetical protein VET85_00270, partial [Stellaceae bacterium]|nr:hypothetical protein [Stellaceae bacterium]
AEFSTCRLVTQARIAGPCDAERRYGGVADDEMRMALRPQELRRAVEGLKGWSKAGLRYPIPPYGTLADPAEDMAKGQVLRPLAQLLGIGDRDVGHGGGLRSALSAVIA